MTFNNEPIKSLIKYSICKFEIRRLVEKLGMGTRSKQPAAAVSDYFLQQIA